MSRLVVAGLSFLLLAVALVPAQAATPSPVQALAPPVTGAAAPYLPTAAVASLGQNPTPTAVQSTCIADCAPYSDISCTVSGTCTAVDRNCAAGERGHLVCNGALYYCPVCQCTNGDIRYVDTGACCKDFLKQQSFQECVDGVWVHQYYSCFIVPHCPEK